MRGEIIYIQIGELSNYTGTHFWNTQEQYLSSHAESEVEPTVSFGETVDGKEHSTLCPRLLAIDRKSYFGTLSASNALGNPEESEDPLQIYWDDGIEEYKQSQIPKSSYQTQLASLPGTGSGSLGVKNEIDDIRYWSDFNRLYLLPRSIQKLPDSSGWEASNSTWNQGQQLFQTYNQNSDFIDGSFRQFAEDCDTVQGIQLVNDVDTFGGFTASFLTAFRDEYQKQSSLNFALNCGSVSYETDIDSVRSATAQVINEALYVRTSHEHSTMNINILKTQSWPVPVWKAPQNFSPLRKYHQSAILAAHIESATLPLRAKTNRRDIFQISQTLKVREDISFGQLSGVFPITPAMDLSNLPIVDFSYDGPVKPSSQYSRIDITRGLSHTQVGSFDNRAKLGAHYTESFHRGAYPLPDLFPVPSSSALSPWYQREKRNTVSQGYAQSTSLVASLSTSDCTVHLFNKYADTITGLTKCPPPSLAPLDISLDDLKDLANDLWTIHDNWGGNTEDADM